MLQLIDNAKHRTKRANRREGAKTATNCSRGANRAWVSQRRHRAATHRIPPTLCSQRRLSHWSRLATLRYKTNIRPLLCTRDLEL
jgi:hypothetical protein